MPIPFTLLLNSNKDEEYYETLIYRQKNDQDQNTSRNYTFIPIRSTVVVQHKDCGLWSHGTIVGKDNHKHNNRSYAICITKTGWLITRNSKHIKPTKVKANNTSGISWTDTVTDPLDNILQQIENQIHINKIHTYNDQLNIHKGNSKIKLGKKAIKQYHKQSQSNKQEMNNKQKRLCK